MGMRVCNARQGSSRLNQSNRYIGDNPIRLLLLLYCATLSPPLSPYSAYKLYSIFHATFSEFVCFGADDHIDPAKLLTFFLKRKKYVACLLRTHSELRISAGNLSIVVLIRFNCGARHSPCIYECAQ
jgi:hypothetical protein